MKESPNIGKILFLEKPSEYHTYLKNMHSTLQKFCRKVICFDRREYYFKYGREAFNKKLLEIVQKEKPDYILTWTTLDEFDFDTLIKIREISPNTKTAAIFGDDSAHFENCSRFFSLFFDYYFTTVKSYVKRYKEEKLNNVFYTTLIDIEKFKPLNLSKKYDVTFIGTQKLDISERYELLKYLMDNGVNLRIYGFGWDKYPEFKDIYYGPLKDEDVVKIINETKVNICFSKDNFGNPQLKARVFEVAACDSFVLTEFAEDYKDYFKKGEELIEFKTKEEMLEKVRYYLKHEDEREKISEKTCRRARNEYGLYNELKIFFSKTRKRSNHKELPKINGKIFQISGNRINFSDEKLKSKLKDFDYVSFKTEKSEFLKYKEYLQAYSLEKSGKSISCCDYYAFSKNLGDYAFVSAKYAANLKDKRLRNRLFYLPQIMVTKSYFLQNIGKFRRIMNNHPIDFIDMKNTVFVSLPLVRIKNFNLKNYEETRDVVTFKFIYNLYSIFRQKKLFSLYPWSILWEIFKGKHFIFKELKKTVFNKAMWSKIKKLETN